MHIVPQLLIQAVDGCSVVYVSKMRSKLRLYVGLYEAGNTKKNIDDSTVVNKPSVLLFSCFKYLTVIRHKKLTQITQRKSEIATLIHLHFIPSQGAANK